jgi:carbon storage regulator
MLVLSRKVGERIVVPNCKVFVTVVAIHGKQVQLGISAPPEVAVHREEVLRRIAGRAAPSPNSARLRQA